jgi:MoaA/NifB/PqqE/SkfB family radical SAM enzyme
MTFTSIMVRSVLDLLDEYFPGGPIILDQLRRARTDVRSLIRLLKPWYHMEQNVPSITVEVTNVCNSKCLFCAYQYQNKFRIGRGVMSDEIFEKTISEYISMGGRSVGFTPFAGEPLLDPKIIARIERVNRLGARTGFFTNGIRLNHIDIERLLKSGINAVTISTAPLDYSMYQLLYRNDHYLDVLQGLQKFLAIRNQIRKDFQIGIAFRSHIPMKQVLSLPDFREAILPHLTPKDNIIVNTRGFDTWGGQIKPEDMIGIMRLGLPPLIKRSPCVWMMYGLYITWDGKVRGCGCRFGETINKDGKDELYLGDLRESTVSEIWFGDEIKQLRRRFERGNLPLVCKNCTVYRSC